MDPNQARQEDRQPANLLSRAAGANSRPLSRELTRGLCETLLSTPRTAVRRVRVPQVPRFWGPGSEHIARRYWQSLGHPVPQPVRILCQVVGSPCTPTDTSSAPGRILIYRMMGILGTIFAGLLGLAFGSFLNVCLSRWPEGESIVQPRSHCRQCSRTLTWWENIPLFSWLALRGRCRTCRTWIGWRYPLVELAIGVLWASSVWRAFSPSLLPDSLPVWLYVALASAVANSILYWILVALAILDAENLWLPDLVTIPGIALGFFFALLRGTLSAAMPLINKMGSMKYAAKLAAITSIEAILAAAALILLIRWLYWLIRRREGIGLGDAKLMALLAAWLGLPGALLAFGLGVVLGAVVALALLAVPSAQRTTGTWALQKLPLGTFLCIGGIVSSLWGAPIIAAYLRWSGF